MSGEKAGRLEGRIALITGAASGLGRRMAERFAEEGARLLLADINLAGAEDVARTIGPAARAIHLDVTSEDGWIKAIDAARQQHGGLHILVNCAGIGGGTTVEDTDLDTWRHVHAVDVDSVFLGCKHAIPLIRETTGREKTRGSILNISSIAGIIASGNMAAYNSAKAAVRHLTKSVALHLAGRDPINCNSVHPAFINTPILDGLGGSNYSRDEMLAKLGRQIPVGHVGEPDDVAWAAVYLCSDEAKFVTGAELYIDGGISAM